MGIQKTILVIMAVASLAIPAHAFASPYAGTYLGGSKDEIGYQTVEDSAGNIYVVGTTASPNFPVTTGAYQTTYKGGDEVFVSKFDPSMNILASTFLGGSLDDYGYGIALGPDGSVWVTGYTKSLDFPTTTGTTNHGKDDVFVSELDPTLSILMKSTTFGGGNDDIAWMLTLDSSGNVYVTGGTKSNNFPTTLGAYQKTFAGGIDAFVTKLDPTLTTILSSTYLGSKFADVAYDIALDNSGDVYVTGYTAKCITCPNSANNFPTTPGAYQRTYRGDISDVFVSKFDNTLSTLLASTLIGGQGRDNGQQVAIDSAGNVYVAGFTNSTNFPTTPGAYQTTFQSAPCTTNCKYDAFVSKLDPSLSTLLASTYLGGLGNDFGHGIALDSTGNVFVTGSTDGLNFPITPNVFQTKAVGVFVSKLDPSLSSLLASTDFGGTSYDQGRGISIDPFGNAVLTGYTSSTNFPTTTFEKTYRGGPADAFLAKLSSDLK